MFSFKQSLAAFVCLLVLIVLLALMVPPVSAASREKGPRKFYLTKTLHDGSQALTACAADYHMASIWEILDPTNLSYNTALGVTSDDSGLGPPSGGLEPFLGWIRTGYRATGGANNPGYANCNAWRSADGADAGTLIFLTNPWDVFEVETVNPWHSLTRSCNAARSVWCVQD